MARQDDLVDRFHALYRELQPELLDRLEMWIDGSEVLPLQASVTLRSTVPGETRRLVIHMHGVSQLRLSPGPMPPRLHLAIQSMVDQQWEDAKYRITDVEQDNDVRILCRNVEIDVVSE